MAACKKHTKKEPVKFRGCFSDEASISSKTGETGAVIEGRG
jgi:hypothetical protein